MTATGIALDAGIMTSLNTNITGIIASILNIAPELIFAGVGVWAVLLIVNKIPSWFKRLIK